MATMIHRKARSVTGCFGQAKARDAMAKGMAKIV
jgi:hypothetical protein